MSMTKILNKPSAESELYDGPSKSQIKRDMDALQALGEELINLSKDSFKKIILPEKLREAVTEARKITSNGAIRRQRQYIGKLMREVDAEPIKLQLDRIKGISNEHTAWLHQIERWRDRLLADETILAEFFDEYPDADLQQIRQLLRNTKREQAQQKPLKSFRELFQLLKTYIPEPSITLPVSLIEDAADEDKDHA